MADHRTTSRGGHRSAPSLLVDGAELELESGHCAQRLGSHAVLLQVGDARRNRPDVVVAIELELIHPVCSDRWGFATEHCKHPERSGDVPTRLDGIIFLRHWTRKYAQATRLGMQLVKHMLLERVPSRSVEDRNLWHDVGEIESGSVCPLSL